MEKQSNKWKLIRQYKNMINSNYHGISLRLTELLRDDKYSNKLIGGELKKISYNTGEVIFNIEKNDDPTDLHIQLLTINGSKQCGLIIIDPEKKTEASFQDIHANDGCYISTIENSNDGKNIVELMIELCKYYGIKRIELKDTSIKKIENYDLELSMYYTMIKGVPWYVQFGFKNIDKEEQDKISRNFMKLKDKKVGDFNENVFIVDIYINLCRKFKNIPIKIFIKMISYYNLKLFANIYDKIYDNLKLEKIIKKVYYLEL
jgi:hypothetical protein